MFRSNYALRCWLAREILDKEVPRKPSRKESALSQKPPRDARYRAWIRSLPCAVCERTLGIEAPHTGNFQDGKGMRQKASDYTCIPLCAEHHRVGREAWHNIGPEAFEQRFELDIKGLVKLLNKLWLDTETAA